MREILAIGLGAGIGTAQTYLLREYVDPTYGRIIPQIQGFGTISSLAGWSIGLITTILGVAGYMGKGPLRGNTVAQNGLIAYGIPALVGGIISGIYPATLLRAPARARAAARPTLRPVTTVRPTAANSLRTVATTVSSVKA